MSQFAYGSKKNLIYAYALVRLVTHKIFCLCTEVRLIELLANRC